MNAWTEAAIRLAWLVMTFYWKHALLALPTWLKPCHLTDLTVPAGEWNLLYTRSVLRGGAFMTPGWLTPAWHYSGMDMCCRIDESLRSGASNQRPKTVCSGFAFCCHFLRPPTGRSSRGKTRRVSNQIYDNFVDDSFLRFHENERNITRNSWLTAPLLTFHRMDRCRYGRNLTGK